MSGFTVCKRSTIEVPIPGCGLIRCDPIAANLDMEAIRTEHGEDGYVSALADYMVSLMLATGTDPERPDHSQSLMFHDGIVATVNGLNEARKKKVASIVSSLCSTQESPATTENGTTTPSKLGSNVTVTQSDEECNLTEPLTT